MDEIRRWWAGVIVDLIHWLRGVWQRFSYGLQHGWDVETFVLLLGVVVIVSAVLIWRRRA